MSTIKISLSERWHSNKLHKISQIEDLISSVTAEARTNCKKLEDRESFGSLRLQHDITNNHMLSRFVDIDALIDEHGNDIASLESAVLPYLSINKHRMLALLSS